MSDLALVELDEEPLAALIATRAKELNDAIRVAAHRGLVVKVDQQEQWVGLAGPVTKVLVTTMKVL